MQPGASRYLDQMTWDEAADALTSYPTLVLPLGARLKEHGHHLPLGNDWNMAEYYASRVFDALPVLMAPTISHGFYPAFTDYPGSVHITFRNALGMLVDMAESFARHGCRKIYVLNTGISTLWVLEPLRQIMAERGCLIEYMNLMHAGKGVREKIREQDEGTHADELETSMMLYIAPQTVSMSRATSHEEKIGPGRLTRHRETSTGIHSPSGVFGDATLASREKGEQLTEAIVADMLTQLKGFIADDFRPDPVRDDYMLRYEKLRARGAIDY